MKEQQYTRLLSCYYEIEDDTRITLGYREGNDSLRLIIGKSRNRYIENIDADFLYLIVEKKDNPQDAFYHYDDYIKYEPAKEGEAYVMELTALLVQLNLSYRELNSKEFRKYKKYEKASETNGLYAYGFMKSKYFWLDADVYRISANYMKKAFVIEEKELRFIQAETFFDTQETYTLIQKSLSEKTYMDLEGFKEFFGDANGLEQFHIEWDNGYVSKEPFSDKWHCISWFCEEGKTRKSIMNLDGRKEQSLGFLYRFIQCKSHQETVGFLNKMKLLGVEI